MPDLQRKAEPDTAVLLSVNALSGKRGDNHLFSNLDCVLREGAAIQVTGANGVGKTTLLRILAGLGRQASGTVNQPIRDCDNTRLTEYRSGILFIGHSLGVNLRLNAVENLLWWLSLCADQSYLADSSKEQMLAACEEALISVGLYEHQLLNCADLSAGQKRRVALARLFLSDLALNARSVWILDEPFTALDVDFCSQVIGQMQTHCARGGGVIFTSHQAIEGLDQAILSLDARN